MHIQFPNNLVFYQDLILQRTSPFISLGGSEALNHWFSSGEKDQLTNFLINNNLLDSYIKKVIDEVGNEVDELIFLTKNTSFKNLVSIGPGCGLVELMYFYKKGFDQILLIDIEESSLHQHLFNSEGSGYASLDATKSFFIANNISPEKIMICNPKKNILPKFEYGLLISLISMGFHYPCNDYVDFILGNINKEGVIILDKRIGAPDPGFSLLSEFLEINNQIESQKKNRICLKAKS